jgi:hypothetical protein
MEMHIYKKLGAAVIADHNWGIYRNLSIENTQDVSQGIFLDGELEVTPGLSEFDPAKVNA